MKRTIAHAIKIAVHMAIGMLLPFAAAAQVSVSLSPVPKLQFLSNSGLPLASGCVFFYAAGTTNPQAAYTDSTGTAQLPNPLILDAGGFSSPTGIWLANQSYKIKVVSAGGVNCVTGTTQYTIDGISSALGLLNLVNTWTASNTFTQPVIITPNSNQLVLGTGGNQTTFNFPAPAGNIVLNTPNIADTLVGRATTDVLTNKTITSPVINGSSTGTGVQGTDSKLLTAGTISGISASLCTDANGGATTTGCIPPAAAQLGCTNFTPVTVSNTNASTPLQTCTIPANSLVQGSLLQIDMIGIESEAAGYTLTLALSIGGGTTCSTTATVGAGNNQPWNAYVKFFVLTAGAAGTANMSCGYASSSSGGGVVGPLGTVGTPTIAVNTTVSNAVQVLVTMSVANAGNTVIGQGLKAVIF